MCDWVDSIDTGKATKCYATWDEANECWVEGCAINDKDADGFLVAFAKKQIKTGENNGKEDNEKDNADTI